MLALKSKKVVGCRLVDYQATSFVIPSGNVTYTSEVLHNRLPTFAESARVKSSAYFGDHMHCPFVFLPYNLNGYKFSLNGEDLLFNNARMLKVITVALLFFPLLLMSTDCV